MLAGVVNASTGSNFGAVTGSNSGAETGRNSDAETGRGKSAGAGLNLRRPMGSIGGLGNRRFARTAVLGRLRTGLFVVLVCSSYWGGAGWIKTGGLKTVLAGGSHTLKVITCWVTP